MSTMYRYTIEDRDGNEEDVVFEHHEYQQAREYAQRWRMRVIANEYEWADSEMIDDFTGEADEESEAAS